MNCFPLHLYFGGTFDPIHNGHLAILQSTANQIDAEQITLIPAGQPYQKKRAVTPSQLRIDMCALALESWRQALPPSDINTLEVQRVGPSYTIDTLKALRQEIGLTTSIVYLIGADQLVNLSTWKDYQHLTQYAHLVVCLRPPFSLDHLNPSVSGLLANHQISDPAPLKLTTHGKIWFNTHIQVDISSTQIRQQFADGQVSLDVPASVADFIIQHKLYS